MAKVPFTAGRIRKFRCPPDKRQAFLWDSDSPGLGLRRTPTGKPAFVFQGLYNERYIRITIGSPEAWPIPEAQAKAREYQRLIDEGIDPRTQKREALARAEQEQAQQEAEAVTVAEAWQVYVAARSPKWGEHHRRDHERLARSPGVSKAGKPTNAGPLHFFMGKRLADITPAMVEGWAEKEAVTRPTAARLSLRLLRAFFTWCAKQDEYKNLFDGNPAANPDAREALGQPEAKKDVLIRAQLPVFFEAAQGLANPVIAAYIQALLLTGARPGELLALKWSDINTRWKSLTIRDKDESKGGKDGTRTIPLTPYVHHLLAGLPRRTEWVFSSDTLNQPIAPPHKRLADVARVAGLDITFHGLRRSYSSLSEWMETMPIGVVAQIQGHKPSATAEKHYKPRELGLLQIHADRFEAWILEQAGIEFDPAQQPGALRVVAGNS